MDCCNDKNLIQNKSEFVCLNCAVIHGYEYIPFDFKYDDYNLIVNNMLQYRKSCYKRKKYLINKCRKIDNNIICFLDDSLEKIRILKNMKRISINKYLNSLYKYYCEKSNIDYKDIINTKNNFKLNENILKIIDEVYEKYKYIEKDDNDIFYL